MYVRNLIEIYNLLFEKLILASANINYFSLYELCIVWKHDNIAYSNSKVLLK